MPMPRVCGEMMLKKQKQNLHAFDDRVTLAAIGTPVMSLVYNKKTVLDRMQVVESINKPCL